MSELITCFLPCRKGSERISKKNITPFAEYRHGLIELKLKQLMATPEIDKILLSTNDDEIINFAQDIASDKIVIYRRDDALASSDTRIDEVVAHAYSLIETGHILWTHVTSPFITADIYSDIIAKYRVSLEKGYDSLMTTTPIRGFLWNEQGPINYDPKIEKWPRTQTLKPIHEVNSAAFLAHRDIYVELDDRVGKRPYFFEIDKLIAHDIDWPEDFLRAELFVKNNFVQI